MTFGTWSTPFGQGLSHITCHGLAPSERGGDGGVTIAAPGALAEFGLAELGLGAIRRARAAG